MKIALAFPGCHRRGGVERVLLESANFLAEKGHEVHIFSCDWDSNLLSPKVHCHLIKLPGWLPASFRPPVFVKLCKQPMKNLSPKADIQAGFGATAPPGSVVWMTSVHATWIEISRATRNFRGKMKQWLNPFHFIILRMENFIVRERNFRTLICLTNEERNAVERIYKVPAREIAVLPNGYSAAEFNLKRCLAIREARRAQLGFTDSNCVIVFVANEIERKGFYPLLLGVARLNDLSIRVLAVGRLDTATATAQIKELKLEGQVLLTGPTNDAAIYYAAADIFALPTKYEAWGLVIIEALACGLPVLTSRLAGASVAVVENETGLLLEDPTDPIQIAEKLRHLQMDPIYRDRENIANSVGRFEWAQILTDYEKLLTDACETNSRNCE